MTSDFDEIKIENFGYDDHVKKFSFDKFKKFFKLKREKINEDLEVNENKSFKRLLKRKKERKNYVDFPSGYGEIAKLLLY